MFGGGWVSGFLVYIGLRAGGHELSTLHCKNDEQPPAGVSLIGLWLLEILLHTAAQTK